MMIVIPGGGEKSSCHQADIALSISSRIIKGRATSVTSGICSACGQAIARLNPRTGVEEWLDGKSPYTSENLRPVW